MQKAPETFALGTHTRHHDQDHAAAKKKHSNAQIGKASVTRKYEGNRGHKRRTLSFWGRKRELLE